MVSVQLHWTKGTEIRWDTGVQDIVGREEWCMDEESRVRLHESSITSAVWKLFLALKQLRRKLIGLYGGEGYKIRMH